MRNSMMAGLLAVLFSASPAFAQQAPVGVTSTSSEPGKVATVETVKASAVVTALDKATRTVTLKGPKGRSFDVIAGDEVQNFDQIKVNDEVVVKYIQAVSLEVRKGGGVRERRESAELSRAEPGAKPAGALARQVTIVADVIDVDPKKKTITLKGPKGRIVELDVKNPDHFKVVKKGDQIEVDYAESLALSVEPAPMKGEKK